MIDLLVTEFRIIGPFSEIASLHRHVSKRVLLWPHEGITEHDPGHDDPVRVVVKRAFDLFDPRANEYHSEVASAIACFDGHRELDIDFCSIRDRGAGDYVTLSAWKKPIGMQLIKEST